MTMKGSGLMAWGAVMNRLMLALLCFSLAGASTAAERVEYYHTDALGSVVAATDESGGVLWREAYRPFGNRIDREVDSRLNTPFYTGKPHDEGTGLSYFGARYYDPFIGRFFGIDPVDVDPANLHSFNRYAYANNSPYTFVDPDGNLPIIPIAIFIAKEIAGEQFEETTGLPAPTVKGIGKRLLKNGGEAALSNISKGGGQVFERVVSDVELKAIRKTGLLRGGREGENFFTNAASLDAKRAQQRLGLDGPLRDSRIQFGIKNNVEVTGPRRASPGQTGTAGGGREFSTKGRTEIEILRVDPLRK